MSGYRLFIGQLVRDVRRREIEDAFSKFGDVVRIDIKNGFGFVEYEHSRDAEEAIRKMDGEEFLGRRIIVEYARGRRRDRGSDRGGGGGGGGGGSSRSGNNTGPERSDYRVIVEGLGRSTSWQDLKDAFRSSGDILFTDVRRDRYQDYYGIVEFRYKEDIEHAIRKMDGAEVNGHKIRVKEDRKRSGKSKSPERKRKRSGSRGRSSSKDRRSRSKDRRSNSKEKERRSLSKERRSLSKERERDRSEDKDKRSPSKEKERERRSGSRDSKPREASEERERKRSRSAEKVEEEKERETKRSKQDDEKEPEKDDREEN